MLNKTKTDILPVVCELPAPLLYWLTYEHSLTEKLKERAGDASLQVLSQRWDAPNWWDRFALNLECESVLHREIKMSAWDVPCWYARTIIPNTTYYIGRDIFKRLETESLGELIFNQPRIKRFSMLHYPINAQSIEYHWLSPEIRGDASALWLRLSVLTVDNDHPFYLIETLLPGLLRY